jgi:hypothetical protein
MIATTNPPIGSTPFRCPFESSVPLQKMTRLDRPLGRLTHPLQMKKIWFALLGIPLFLNCRPFTVGLM